MKVDLHTHTDNSDKDIISVRSFRYGVELIKDCTYCSAAVHPWDVEVVENSILERFEAEIDRFFAVSEVGLDRFHPNFKKQYQYFEQQLQIAQKYRKVVVVHSVRSHNEVIELLKKYNDVKAVIHSFVGGGEIARKYLDLGAALSFSPLSFRSSKTLEVVESTPICDIFLESDQSGESIYTIYNRYCQIKNMQIEQVEADIFKNFNTFFNV
ncbi:MAG: TatD family hydrolase [Rikenellaceae bacterium]